MPKPCGGEQTTTMAPKPCGEFADHKEATDMAHEYIHQGGYFNPVEAEEDEPNYATSVHIDFEEHGNKMTNSEVSFVKCELGDLAVLSCKRNERINILWASYGTDSYSCQVILFRLIFTISEKLVEHLKYFQEYLNSGAFISTVLLHMFRESAEVIRINKEARWLYAELISHISFHAKSHENSLFEIFLKRQVLLLETF